MELISKIDNQTIFDLKFLKMDIIPESVFRIPEKDEILNRINNSLDTYPIKEDKEKVADDTKSVSKAEQDVMKGRNNPKTNKSAISKKNVKNVTNESRTKDELKERIAKHYKEESKKDDNASRSKNHINTDEIHETNKANAKKHRERKLNKFNKEIPKANMEDLF